MVAVVDVAVGQDDVSPEDWRPVEAAAAEAGEGHRRSDIRSYFSAKELPPPIKCPLAPVPPPSLPRPARFWRHLMRAYQTDSQRHVTRSAALRLAWGRMGVLPLGLDGLSGGLSLVADPVSCLEFDELGSLLAAGTVNGVLRIFDFDEYLSSLSRAVAERTDDG